MGRPSVGRRSTAWSSSMKARTSLEHPAPAIGPPTPESPGPSSGPLLSPTAWVILVGGSLTAAALATTIVFELKGSAAGDDLREAQKQVSSASACRGADSPACGRVRELADQRN